MNIKEKLDLAVNATLEEMKVEIANALKENVGKTPNNIVTDLESFAQKTLGFNKDNTGRFTKEGKDGMTLNIELGEVGDHAVVNTVAGHVSLDEEEGVESDSYSNDKVTAENYQSTKLALATFIKKWSGE